MDANINIIVWKHLEHRRIGPKMKDRMVQWCEEKKKKKEHSSNL